MNDIVDTLQQAAITQTVSIEVPDEDELVEIEEELLLPIPREFKSFLMQVSHLVIGSLEPVTVTDPNAHTHLPEVNAQAWQEGLPREFVVVCKITDGYYFISQEGEVQLWQHHEIMTDLHWDDIWHWAEDVWLKS